MSIDGFSYTQAVVPVSEGPNLPFLGLTEKDWEKAISTGGTLRQVMDEAFKKKGLLLLVVYSQGSYGMSAMTPLFTVEDWKGIKARVVGSQLTVVARLMGAELFDMTGGEAVDAMRRGMIEAGTVPPSAAYGRGYGEFIKYWVYWGLAESLCPIYVNMSSFEALPSDYQKALLSAAAEMEPELWAAFYQDNTASLEGLKKLGVEIVIPEASEIAKAAAIANPVNEEWAAKIGPEAQDFLRVVKQIRGY